MKSLDRAYSPENFLRPVQNDFCNKICQEATFGKEGEDHRDRLSPTMRVPHHLRIGCRPPAGRATGGWCAAGVARAPRNAGLKGCLDAGCLAGVGSRGRQSHCSNRSTPSRTRVRTRRRKLDRDIATPPDDGQQKQGQSQHQQTTSDDGKRDEWTVLRRQSHIKRDEANSERAECGERGHAQQNAD
jgi:hypothetical protein